LGGNNTGRTRFCVSLADRPYPFLRGIPRSRAKWPNLFLRTCPHWQRTHFCAAARRNGYAALAVAHGKPLVNKGFYPQKQVRPRSCIAASRPTFGWSPFTHRGFSDESSNARRPQRDDILMCEAWRSGLAPQKQVRTDLWRRCRSVRLLSWKTYCENSQRKWTADTGAEIGTPLMITYARGHAELGTHWAPRPPDQATLRGLWPQKRVRSVQATPVSGCGRPFSVDNTVDNPMLSPQIPVRPLRRSGYGFTQKRVREHAESGSHLRRIGFGFAP